MLICFLSFFQSSYIMYVSHRRHIPLRISRQIFTIMGFTIIKLPGNFRCNDVILVSTPASCKAL